MLERLSRRGVLRLGSCAPFAGSVLALPSSAIAAPSKVSELWDTYSAIRSENNRRSEIWREACQRASAASPDLPEGLAFPNPQFAPWLQFDREGVICAIRKREGDEIPGLYYRPEILADFLDDPPSMNNELDRERVPRILAVIRDLLPKAEGYRAAVKEAFREADEMEAAFDFDEIVDRQIDASNALMDALVTSASDFVFKARLIRQRLDDELDVGDEAEKIADQILSFWASAGV